jgi:hypothetical protein
MIFETTDCFRRKVGLDANTWGKHILIKHPEMKGNEKPIKETIEEPDFVYKSGIVENSDVFYRMHEESTYPKLYIKVAVSYDDNEYGRVLSCWFTSRVTGVETGGIKYVKSKI